jgi:MoxR-like ATPase
MTPDVDRFAAAFTSFADNVERALRGKRDVVELALTCLFAEGHLLIEDVPGVGKTTLARAMAVSLRGRLSRIQFTPDLLPTDVTGVSVFHPGTGDFQFHPGPVFANVVHGDEINRASPKTQSALLEVMAEHQVTIDGRAHPIPRPFLVIATQNPVDLAGTYPLPEAQLDRFLMRLRVGYPDPAAEAAVLAGAHGTPAIENLPAVLDVEQAAALMAVADAVHVAADLNDYIVRIAVATRESDAVRLGASPRAGIALSRAARVRAAADGRSYVVPEDIRTLALPVLAHRLILTPDSEARGLTDEDVVRRALADVPAPRLTAGV